MKLIVAADEEFGIARDGKIPWSTPNDQQFFKLMTYGSRVVMGRVTYESFKKPLPGRISVVLSKSSLTIEDYLKLSDENNNDWIIGGAEIYKEFLDRDLVTDIYISKIAGKFGCDKFIKIPENFAKIASFQARGFTVDRLIKEKCNEY